MNIIDNTKNVKKQYENSDNLNIRTNFHEKYSSNQKSFFDFLFEKYDLFENARIIELGCGSAGQWNNHLNSLPDNSNLILSDFSESMIKSIGSNIKEKKNVKTEVLNIENIPYSNQSFDIAIANHMLYHVPDIDKALSEVSRILKKKGVFYASTNSNYGIRYFLNQILKKQNPLTESFYESYGFSMQNGEEYLKKFFSQVNCYEYKDTLVFTEVEPLMTWVKSIRTIATIEDYELEFLKKYLENDLAKNGKIIVPKEACLFVAVK